MAGGDKFQIELTTAEVLATRSVTGDPIFWRNKYGAGQVFVLCAPLENEFAQRPQLFQDLEKNPVWQVCDAIKPRDLDRLVMVGEPQIAATEHTLEDGSIVVALLNHDVEPCRTDIECRVSVTMTVLRGGGLAISETKISVDIGGLDGTILHLSKQSQS